MVCHELVPVRRIIGPTENPSAPGMPTPTEGSQQTGERTPMRLQDVTAALHLGAHTGGLAQGWDESSGDRPAGGIPCLRPGSLSESCRETYLPQDITALVLKAGARIEASSNLSALAWHCHHRLFHCNCSAAEMRTWPLPSHMGPLAGFFYVVVLLSGTSHRRRIHEQRHIPADIVRDTVYDLELCIRTERQDKLEGRLGIAPGFLGWLMHEWRGDLYRLGRLQFIPDRFFGKLRAYRHRTTRVVVALAEDGMRFRGDGRFDGAGNVFDERGAWEAQLELSEDAVSGSPISPAGVALQRKVRLPLDEWDQALAPDDPILAIHIPAGPPMAFDRCGESFHQAMAFFPKYFPDRPFLAFACGSWILDSQFQDLLPATSNLVRFQKEMFLFPWPRGSGEMPWQVRLPDGAETKHTPPKMTTMQKAFYDHAAKGGRFCAGGSFLLPEDLAWDRQVYRRQQPPWE